MINNSDMYGTMNVKARLCEYYLITFIDEYTQLGHIYQISLIHQVALDVMCLWLKIRLIRASRLLELTEAAI